jgi:hypothetical protein
MLTVFCIERMTSYPEFACGQRAVFTVLYRNSGGQEVVESACTIHTGKLMKRVVENTNGVYADVRIAKTSELKVSDG